MGDPSIVVEWMDGNEGEASKRGKKYQIVCEKRECSKSSPELEPCRLRVCLEKGGGKQESKIDQKSS
jgi:hypothetical protein